eukprot:scaffold11790_cov97-Skeletonema_menzelii.AAC.2
MASLNCLQSALSFTHYTTLAYLHFFGLLYDTGLLLCYELLYQQYARESLSTGERTLWGLNTRSCIHRSIIA